MELSRAKGALGPRLIPRPDRASCNATDRHNRPPPIEEEAT
jgi:hypothetical protein